MPLILKKTMLGGGFVLVAACFFLWVGYGKARDANATLRAELALQDVALAATEEALAAALLEVKHTENVMDQRLAAERAINERVKTELQRTSAALAKLRQEHEDIKAFLAIPVPPSFVDGWLRGRSSGGDTIEGRAGPPSPRSGS